MICKVVDKYFLTFDNLLDDDKSPKDYGSGHLLYRSEMNFIKAVNSHPDSNSKELSEALNITKGAVTQFGNKLEERDIITRYLKPGNKKEKYYKLTKKGIDIINSYIAYHEEANTKICEYLSTLDKYEKSIIMDFLNKMSSLEITRFECGSNCCSIDKGIN